MNFRSRILLLAALGVAVLAMLYVVWPRLSGPADSGAGMREGASGRPMVSGSVSPVESGAVADGHKAAFVPAPARAAGALIDPQPPGVARHAGAPVVATVRVGDRETPELMPNQVGKFPAVYVKRGQKVAIRLRFPEAEPGARAAVSVEDGGYLADNKPAMPLVLDGRSEGEFEFTAGQDEGQYRVVVRQGADTRILVLWAEAG